MENHFKDLIETDAASVAPRSSDVVSTIGGSEPLDLNGNVQQSVAAVNNNMLMAQTNTSTVVTQNVMTFNNSSGINFGTVVHIGWSPGSSNKNAKANGPAAKPDETVYKKTPTIKAMLESKDPISIPLLEYISGQFGFRWRDITILLEISQLFVDRMHEDHFGKGIQEVNI